MRLFYALTFTEAAIEQIEDYRSTVSSLINSDSLVEASNFHITLVFLGEVSASQIKKYVELIDSLFLETSQVTVNEISSFQRNKEQLVWLAVELEDWLVELQQSLHTQLVDLGMTFDNRQYLPHITLARHVPVIHRLEGLPFTPFKLQLRSIALMESYFNNNQLTYRPLVEIIR